jgi:hypothetical protein
MIRKLTPSPDVPEGIVEDAILAFWDVVARRFPQARSGDLSIGMTIDFKAIATQAVEEWIANNATAKP